MAPQRKQSDGTLPESTPHPALLAETLRLAQPPAEDSRGEEKVSIFWKLFGGTLLSIAALVVVTVYQQVSGSLADLRAGQARLKDSLAEMVRKEEVQQRTTPLWAAIKETSGEVPALRTRATQLEMQVRVLERERKELQERLQQLSERLARMEGRQDTKPASKAKTPPRTMAPVD